MANQALATSLLYHGATTVQPPTFASSACLSAEAAARKTTHAAQACRHAAMETDPTAASAVEGVAHLLAGDKEVMGPEHVAVMDIPAVISQGPRALVPLSPPMVPPTYQAARYRGEPTAPISYSPGRSAGDSPRTRQHCKRSPTLSMQPHSTDATLNGSPRRFEQGGSQTRRTTASDLEQQFPISAWLPPADMPFLESVPTRVISQPGCPHLR